MSFALSQYQAARVTTASPLAVLVSLYEGTVRFLREAIEREDAKDLSGRARALSRAHAILTELRATLDHDQAPELCAQLDSLYEFGLHCISTATLQNRAREVEPVIPVLLNLLSAWQELSRKAA